MGVRRASLTAVSPCAFACTRRRAQRTQAAPILFCAPRLRLFRATCTHAPLSTAQRGGGGRMARACLSLPATTSEQQHLLPAFPRSGGGKRRRREKRKGRLPRCPAWAWPALPLISGTVTAMPAYLPPISICLITFSPRLLAARLPHLMGGKLVPQDSGFVGGLLLCW